MMDSTTSAPSRKSEDQTPFLPMELEEDSVNGSGEFTYGEPKYGAGRTRSSRRRRFGWCASPLWLFATLVLLGMLVVQNAYLFMLGGYEKGFTTDLAHLHSHIKLQQTRFKGAIRDTADGEGMHVPEPATDGQGRRFTGPPSPEIDEAWHDLVYGRYVAFTNAEIDWMNAHKGVPPLTSISHNMTSYVEDEGYYGGPDMLHSLHCINGLRKHIDMDYYNESMDIAPKFQRMHIYHCIEQLRQAVLCHGDLTPVTLKPVRNSKGEVWALLGETERMHTCRNGEELGSVWVEAGLKKGRVDHE